MGRQYLASFVYRAAKAREGFSAVAEHDGISESPRVTVENGGLTNVFFFGSTPFNTPAARKIIDDKWTLYRAAQGHVPRPHTEAFLKNDPRSNEDVLASIMGHIEDDAHRLNFPIILKPNSGSLAKDVFLANSPEEALHAISTIRQNTSWGDYLLAQQYLGDEQGPFPEVRAMCLDGECLIMYERTIDQADDADAAIWGGETIQATENPLLKAQAQRLARHLHQIHDISYIGLDLKVDREGRIWLLEGNSSPMGLEKIKNQIPNGQALIDNLTDRILDKLDMHARSAAQTEALMDRIAAPNKTFEGA